MSQPLPQLPSDMKHPPAGDEDVDMKTQGMTQRPLLPSERFLPECDLADWAFHSALPSTLLAQQDSAKAKLMMKIQQNNMLPYYLFLCNKFKWAKDEELIKSMEAANSESLQLLEDKIADAKENLGESEYREVTLEKAHHFCEIGDKHKAIESYEECLGMTFGPGGKLDILLTLVRLGLYFQDRELTSKSIERSEHELKKGGDWERKNKLKVYKGVLHMVSREFEKAAELLVSCLATFTSNELISFDRFVFFTAIAALICLPRPDFKAKILQAPEVIQVTQRDSVLHAFITSFYQAEYSSFMSALLGVMDRVRTDRYLSHHYLYLIRQLRLRAYRQFLEPFQSVTISEMAQSFSLSEETIEDELASLISTGKLACKIDLVTGVIESNRQDIRNQLYLDTLKHGDALLNRIQKLSRVIDM